MQIAGNVGYDNPHNRVVIVGGPGRFSTAAGQVESSTLLKDRAPAPFNACG